MSRIDELLTLPYRIIDILPERVPEGSPGQYFTVEKYFLRDPSLRQRQLNLLLKLNCCYDLTLISEDEEIRNPAPEVWTERIGRESLNILAGGKTLITADRTDIHMTVYSADEKLLTMLGRLAEAEGLFMWKEFFGS